jgi:hypothetical protein
MTLGNVGQIIETSRNVCMAQTVEHCVQAFRIKGLAGPGLNELLIYDTVSRAQ